MKKKQFKYLRYQQRIIIIVILLVCKGYLEILFHKK
jgi:hypothetical protein